MPVPERAEQEEGPALRPVLARHGREMAPAPLAEARWRRCGRSGVAWLRGAENMGMGTRGHDITKPAAAESSLEKLGPLHAYKHEPILAVMGLGFRVQGLGFRI